MLRFFVNMQHFIIRYTHKNNTIQPNIHISKEVQKTKFFFQNNFFIIFIVCTKTKTVGFLTFYLL